MTPVYLSIAGSDCSAGAGIQADLKTGFALGCYPLTAITCVVSEVPGHVAGIVPMEPDFVASQMRECLRSFPVAAAKTGMLYSPEIVRAVAAELPEGLPLVVDPVMIATAGEALMQSRALEAYEQHLFPRACIITPNLDELVCLTGCATPRTPAELQAAAAALAQRLHCAVLAKGGHLQGDTCTDILVAADGRTRIWEHPRTTGLSTHGTGCTLSAAIAAGLAQGLSMEASVAQALSYTAAAIAASHRFPHTPALNHHLPETHLD